ncbi:septal ring lytic transglycosylase RlpA family protein [Sulfurimonas sp. HSL3-7]|uniref:septal ring lytic transglycosylase RlpA family protein n=1 Tax=Sulfonitrofixus jiaomeiensis TaxID=3131938 RepID=UPI0031F8EE0E
MYIKIISVALSAAIITGCSTRGVKIHSTRPAAKHYETASTTKGSSYVHPTMRPYTVFGKRYYPTKVRVGEKFTGISSWYGPDFDGKATSSGEIYDMHALTAAHKTLPMNTVVKVTNLDNGKNVVVRINDRGPFVGTRIIDLSNRAAHAIDMVDKGTARVRLEVLGFEGKKSKNIASKKELRSGPQEMVSGSTYALQIGSFSKIEGALITQAKYDNFRGYHTVIKDTEYNNKRIFRVWLSGFKSEAEARDFKSDSPFDKAFIVGE